MPGQNRQSHFPAHRVTPAVHSSPQARAAAALILRVGEYEAGSSTRHRLGVFLGTETGWSAGVLLAVDQATCVVEVGAPQHSLLAAGSPQTDPSSVPTVHASEGEGVIAEVLV